LNAGLAHLRGFPDAGMRGRAGKIVGRTRKRGMILEEWNEEQNRK
jgi:hypothetical protein